jgi:hypothetical protein
MEDKYHSHGSTAYWGPDDEAARNVQDLTHHLWLQVLKRAFVLCPNGTSPKPFLIWEWGTGIWAIDVADQNPEASVKGTDLSAIQPPWVTAEPWV